MILRKCVQYNMWRVLFSRVGCRRSAERSSLNLYLGKEGPRAAAVLERRKIEITSLASSSHLFYL